MVMGDDPLKEKQQESSSDTDLGWDNAKDVYSSWKFKLIITGTVLIQFFLVSHYAYKLIVYETVSAELVNYSVQPKQIGTTTKLMYAPVYEYLYAGETYHSTSSVFRGLPQADIGDHVQFLVDRDNPENIQHKLSPRLIMIKIISYNLREVINGQKKDS